MSKKDTLSTRQYNPVLGMLPQEPVKKPAPPQKSDKLREDGTTKGPGWIGSIPSKDGKEMTELSFDFDVDGKKIFAPLLVPTLSKEEVDYLSSGGKPTDAIYKKAQDFAMEKVSNGESTFKEAAVDPVANDRGAPVRYSEVHGINGSYAFDPIIAYAKDGKRTMLDEADYVFDTNEQKEWQKDRLQKQRIHELKMAGKHQKVPGFANGGKLPKYNNGGPYNPAFATGSFSNPNKPWMPDAIQQAADAGAGNAVKGAVGGVAKVVEKKAPFMGQYNPAAGAMGKENMFATGNPVAAGISMATGFLPSGKGMNDYAYTKKGAEFGSMAGPVGAVIGAGVGVVADYFTNQSDNIKQNKQAQKEGALRASLVPDPYGEDGYRQTDPRNLMADGGPTGPGKNPATRSDSLALYDNSNKVLDYYMKSPNGEYLLNSSMTGPNLSTHEFNDNNAKGFVKMGEFNDVSKLQSIKRTADSSLYRQNLSSSKYKQREVAYSILDLDAPMQLFHRSVNPTMKNMYRNNTTGDQVMIFGYDPISVKPWDMLSPIERVARVKKHGDSGTPSDPNLREAGPEKMNTTIFSRDMGGRQPEPKSSGLPEFDTVITPGWNDERVANSSTIRSAANRQMSSRKVVPGMKFAEGGSDSGGHVIPAENVGVAIQDAILAGRPDVIKPASQAEQVGGIIPGSGGPKEDDKTMYPNGGPPIKISSGEMFVNNDVFKQMAAAKGVDPLMYGNMMYPKSKFNPATSTFVEGGPTDPPKKTEVGISAERMEASDLLEAEFAAARTRERVERPSWSASGWGPKGPIHRTGMAHPRGHSGAIRLNGSEKVFNWEPSFLPTGSPLRIIPRGNKHFQRTPPDGSPTDMNKRYAEGGPTDPPKSSEPEPEYNLVGRSGGSRSWRNNNPGNIMYNDYIKKLGAIGTDGRFAIFPDVETGRRAQERLLFDSANYKGLTMPEAIRRWAPDHENDTDSYISKMGGDPGRKMSEYTSEERSVFLDAMQEIEGWKEGSMRKENAVPRETSEFPVIGMPNQILNLAAPSGPTVNDVISGPGSSGSALSVSPNSVQVPSIGQAMNSEYHNPIAIASLKNGGRIPRYAPGGPTQQGPVMGQAPRPYPWMPNWIQEAVYGSGSVSQFPEFSVGRDVQRDMDLGNESSKYLWPSGTLIGGNPESVPGQSIDNGAQSDLGLDQKSPLPTKSENSATDILAKGVSSPLVTSPLRRTGQSTSAGVNSKSDDEPGYDFDALNDKNRAMMWSQLPFHVGAAMYNIRSRRDSSPAPIPTRSEEVDFDLDAYTSELNRNRQNTNAGVRYNMRGRSGAGASLVAGEVDSAARRRNSADVESRKNQQDVTNTQIRNADHLRNTGAINEWKRYESAANDADRRARGQALSQNITSALGTVGTKFQNDIYLDMAKNREKWNKWAADQARDDPGRAMSLFMQYMNP